MARMCVINFTVETEERTRFNDDASPYEFVGVIKLNGDPVFEGEPMYDEGEAEDIAVGSFTQQLRGLLKDQDT
jgi:hypothetical protein